MPLQTFVGFFVGLPMDFYAKEYYSIVAVEFDVAVEVGGAQ
jgi:hypothetical protein